MVLLDLLYCCVFVCRGMSEPVVGPFIYSAGSEQVFKEVGYCIDPASLLDGTEGIYDPAAGNHTVPIALVMLTDIKNGEQGREVCMLR